MLLEVGSCQLICQGSVLCRYFDGLLERGAIAHLIAGFAHRRPAHIEECAALLHHRTNVSTRALNQAIRAYMSPLSNLQWVFLGQPTCVGKLGTSILVRRMCDVYMLLWVHRDLLQSPAKRVRRLGRTVEAHGSDSLSRHCMLKDCNQLRCWMQSDMLLERVVCNVLLAETQAASQLLLEAESHGFFR